MNVFYGKENPSRLRRHTMHVVYLVMVLAFYGVWQDFVPSDTWANVGFYLALSIAVPLTFLLIYCYESGVIEFGKKGSNARKIGSYLLTGPILFGFFWVSIVHGAADIATRAFGANSVVETIVAKDHHHSRRSCDYRLELVQLNNAFPAYLCTNSSQFSKLAVRSKIKVIGNSSFLGLAIGNWVPVATNQ